MEENDTENTNQWESLLEQVEADIAEHEKEIQPLKVMRNYLRGKLGLPIEEVGILKALEAKPRTGRLPVFNNGDFYGLTQAEAGHKILEHAKQSLTLDQILKVLTDSGYELGGKDPRKAMYVSLSRSRKLVKVASNTFDLAKRRPIKKYARKEKRQMPTLPTLPHKPLELPKQ